MFWICSISLVQPFSDRTLSTFSVDIYLFIFFFLGGGELGEFRDYLGTICDSYVKL